MEHDTGDEEVASRGRVILALAIGCLLLMAFAWSLFANNESDLAGDTDGFSAEELLTDVEPAKVAEAGPVKVTPGEVTDFLAAYYTYTWQDSAAEVKRRVAAAGGVSGTAAASPWGSREAYEWCSRDYCSSEILRVWDVSTSAGSEASARVTLRSAFGGVEQTYDAYCRVALNDAAKADRGLFVDVACPGGDG